MATPDVCRLEIRLLGRASILRDGAAIELPRSRKARALLAYLVTSGQARSREHLCDFFWDGPANPRAELRWCLAKIRPLLNDDTTTRLVADGDYVSFLAEDVALDITRVRELIPSAPEDVSTHRLRQVAGLLRGPFLESVDLPDCYAFDAWCVAERQALQQLQDGVLRTLVQRLLDQPDTALPYARDRLVLDPFCEDAHADLVMLLHAMGRTAEARQRYEHCRRMLQHELGQAPSARLEQLHAQLNPTSQPLSAPPSLSSAPSSDAPPLVGRQRELTTIRGALEERAPLLISGEPGIGKSRLLQEISLQLQGEQVQVLRGRAFEMDATRPYAPWIDGLRSIPIPATWRPELAALLPELGPTADDSGDRNRLFSAVAQVVIDMTRTSSPAAIVLDDLQWFDEASAALLHYVAHATTGHPVAFILAARGGELECNAAAQRAVHALRRDRALRILTVEPLSPTETATIAHTIAPEVDGDHVFRESEGNPLFALEIARSHQGGQPLLGDTLGGLIAGRLAGVGKEAAEILPWAAALGRRLNPDRLAAVMNLPGTTLLQGLEDLERRAILRATDAGHWEFAHDLIGHAAYQSLSEPRRRMIHLQIARSLARSVEQSRLWSRKSTLQPHVSGRLARSSPMAESSAGEVAYHADLGGDHALAARACAVAGRYALRIHAYADAVALAQQGQTHLAPLPDETRLQRAFELLELYIHPGMEPYQPPDLEQRLRTLVADARAIGTTTQVHDGLYLIAVLLYLRGRYSDALDVTVLAERAGRTAEPATVVQAVADTARCLGMLGRDMDRAAQLAEEAHHLAEQLDVRELGCELPLARGLVAHHRGELVQARAHIEHALALAKRDRTPWWECYCLSRLPMIELERQAPDDALDCCRTLQTVADKLGDNSGAEAPFAQALEALARLQRGDPQATARLDHALEQLHAADSQWMIAYVQNMAALIHWQSEQPDAARERAEKALHAAGIIDLANEVIIARALLARTALATGDRTAALAHLDHMHTVAHGCLSARARHTAAEAEAVLGRTLPA
ncbi:ATP-binding protein [Aquisalimonas asiatica]|uniref:Transcriptional activator domain-containing protein n=1 Tax=Aquisalimonas asiatica TaxID=406100 RepID=A0A1H8VST4_9GAMM|nr:AAA family ATPase [Aquisalimonas asiatica]SEP18466.1 transcriptional activator domain-containing protein [Aquisalimonas asiatica]